MKSVALALLVLVSTTAHAQTTTINPTATVFTAPAQHFSNYPDGSPMLTSYEFNAVAMNTFGAIALTVNLGKPTPDGTMTITVTIPQLATITPNAIYTATVTAMGPGGSGVSPASNPFRRDCARTAGKSGKCKG